MRWAVATFVSFGNGGDDVPGWVAVVGLVGLALLVPVVLGLLLRYRDRRAGRAGPDAPERPRGLGAAPDGWGYDPRLVWGLIGAATLVLLVLYATG